MKMPLRYQVGIIGLVLWSYFARPIYDATWIAIGRGANKIVAARSLTFALPYDDLVGLNTQLVQEMDSYLLRTRDSGGESLLTPMRNARTVPDFQKASEPLRALLRQSLGFPLADALQGNDFSKVQRKLLGEDELATYTLLTIPVLGDETKGFIHSVGILITPKSHEARMPLIIAAHGRGGMPDLAKKIPVMQPYNRDLAMGAVQRGWSVFEPIFVFYGKDQPENIRDLLTVRAQEAGTSLLAMEFTKTTRALDYLLTFPEYDSSRVAMVGISYGGFNTLYTTALDPRIKVSVVAAYFNDRAQVLDSSEPNGFSDWRFPNSLGALRDPNIAALVCPRPLQIQAGNQDQLFPVKGARKTAPEARAFYSQLGLESKFDYHEFVGRHDFDGDAAWDFIASHWTDGMSVSR